MDLEQDPLIVEALARAQRAVVLTGAGVSAASGVPTFRDALTGLWANDDPMQLATPEAFRRDPRKLTAWYEHRRGLVQACRPNAGHLAIARLQRRFAGRGGDLVLVTQNVDGLHTQAGSDGPFAPGHLHGTLRTWRCDGCGDKTDRSPEVAPLAYEDCPPVCGLCGGGLRPDVVWFGEVLPADVLSAAQSAAASCDVFIAAGTSGVVYPAAQLVQFARENGAVCIDVNPGGSENADAFDHFVREGSQTCFPRWADALEAADG